MRVQSLGHEEPNFFRRDNGKFLHALRCCLEKQSTCLYSRSFVWKVRNYWGQCESKILGQILDSTLEGDEIGTLRKFSETMVNSCMHCAAVWLVWKSEVLAFILAVLCGNLRN